MATCRYDDTLSDVFGGHWLFLGHDYEPWMIPRVITSREEPFRLILVHHFGVLVERVHEGRGSTVNIDSCHGWGSKDISASDLAKTSMFLGCL